MAREIESLISAERWDDARQAIRSALDAEPTSHWLLARLALTYYEQRRYGDALAVAERARVLAPRCPLVQWEVAGALDMLGRTTEAVRVYRRLIRRGVDSIAHGDCGEGLAWARGLIADCWYRVAHCHRRDGRRSLSARAFEEHLRLRGPGCRSIYSIGGVKRDLQALKGG
jgi:tetratricopeptide (TPR) repeat protein